MSARERTRTQWLPADLGGAMRRHQAAHAPVQKRRDGLESRAFHRDGQNRASLIVWPDRGAWADARSGVSGGAREYARDVAGMDLVSFMEQWGCGGGSPPARPRVDGAPPPAVEVRALWDACTSVDDDDDARAWLTTGRALTPARVADADLARVIPRGVRAPTWATAIGTPWAHGFRVVVQLVDAHGAFTSIHARRTSADPTLPKGVSPRGYSARGLVMADALGRALLAGDTHAREHVLRLSTAGKHGLVIVEGVPSFLAIATDASDANDDCPAVIGVLAGGWTADHAARLPDNARILVDTDHDAAGDGYAAKIAATFADRAVELRRMTRVRQ